ncbi:MAG: hypothetical protein ACI4U3_06160 [Traorella sp.]
MKKNRLFIIILILFLVVGCLASFDYYRISKRESPVFTINYWEANFNEEEQAWPAYHYGFLYYYITYNGDSYYPYKADFGIWFSPIKIRVFSIKGY